MDWDAQRHEQPSQERALSRTHEQVLQWVPVGSRVLELGCATGSLGARLSTTRHCEVVGVELDADAARVAADRGLAMRVGSLEDAEFRASITESFDVVVATNVLARLRDPSAVLEAMKRWVRPFGRAVVAVPNVAAWSMRVAMLWRGRLEYPPARRLDDPHLRFYTWDTFHQLVRSHGWLVDDAVGAAWELPMGRTATRAWQKLVRSPADQPVERRSLHGRVGQTVDEWATRTRPMRDRWAERLGAQLPNLCATHIALLLRPPPQD